MGFGQNVTGGRGGTVYHVTTLADSGPGSFRDAVNGSGRIIVFDVGGYIKLNSAVSCKGNLTIAGQTAPGGGIGFRGGEISFSNRSNIICRYIRIRPGSETASSTDDALAFADGRNMIFDHVSLEFGPWNNVGCVSSDWQNTPVTEVTFQNCLNANPTGQQFGAHTESVSSTMSWFYTLFANSHNRNPLSKINDTFINNVLYNCDAGYTTHTSTSFDHDIVNNYFIAGPASTGNIPWFQIDANQSIYYSGNFYDSDENGVLGGGITTPYWYQGVGTVLGSPWSSLTSTSTLYSARAAYRVTISQAGAFPRDQIDELVISQTKTLGNAPSGTGAGTAGPIGSLYTSQTQTGLGNNGYGTINGGTLPTDTDGDGMPDYFEQANGFNLGSNDAMTIGGDGYARIEKFINWLADPHTSTTTNSPVVVDLWQYTSGFTNDSPVYTVSGAVNGGVTISNSHYAVFTPTASFIGMGSYQFRVNSADGSGYTNTVSVAISALQPPSNLVWQGDGIANVWTNGGPENWLKDGSPVAFNIGDNVTFDDSGSATPSLNLPASISPGAVSFVASQDYTLSGAGGLIGNGSLYKVGPGKLTLNTINSFAKGVTINEGVVQLGDEFSVNGSLGGSVTNNDTLILANPTSVTSAASITGSGVVIKRGAGNHTLSGTQTYTNLTTVEAGTLTFAGTPPPGDITNNGVVNFNLSSSPTYAGNMSGPGALNISASGQTVTLSGNSSHGGGTTNAAGTVILMTDHAAGSGPVSYLLNGSVKVGGNAVITNTFLFDTTVDFMMDTFSGGGTWAGDIVPLTGGASFRPGGTDGVLTLTGNADLAGRNFIIPKGSVQLAGNANFSATGNATAFGRNSTANSAFVTIRDNAVVSLGALNLGGGQATGGRVTVTIRDNALLSTGTQNFNLHNSTRTATYTLVSLDGGTLAVGGFTKSMTGAAQLTTNFFNGGILQATKSNSVFLPALNGLTCYVQAGGAKIDDGGFTITIVAPLLHDPTLGATVDGGLTKLGSGTLTFTNNGSTFTGPTAINTGTLAIYASFGSSSISGSASVYIGAGALLDLSVASGNGWILDNRRTLYGNGAIKGNFTLGFNGVMSPGSNSIGTLTFSNSLTLAVGSSNIFEISHAPLTNDVAKVLGAITNGGTLVITNISGTLAAGDSFRLFDATSYSGSFSTVILPPLLPGLAWTNQLSTSGTIAVISTAPANPPVFGAVSAAGSNLLISGSNGTPNASYYLLTSTNVSLPSANWSRVATNQFDANGLFNLTNPVDPATPQLFYRLQLP